ncbi:hypothetical protein WS68_16280 [Burkholderia sp. TSV86]|nr:hypothetical protein WS68_16280 [Burkholderia sp. TSV86]
MIGAARRSWEDQPSVALRGGSPPRSSEEAGAGAAPLVDGLRLFRFKLAFGSALAALAAWNENEGVSSFTLGLTMIYHLSNSMT